MTLYVYQMSETTLITHDGHIQLGMYNMTMEQFLSKTEINYIETYWVPDIFTQRYKRANYQKLLQSASIGTKIE